MLGAQRREALGRQGEARRRVAGDARRWTMRRLIERHLAEGAATTLHRAHQTAAREVLLQVERAVGDEVHPIGRVPLPKEARTRRAGKARQQARDGAPLGIGEIVEQRNQGTESVAFRHGARKCTGRV